VVVALLYSRWLTRLPNDMRECELTLMSHSHYPVITGHKTTLSQSFTRSMRRHYAVTYIEVGARNCSLETSAMELKL